MSYYSDVIMSMMASQITSLTIVYSTVYWCADRRIHQSSASPVNSRHKWPTTCKMFPFDDVIMHITVHSWYIMVYFSSDNSRKTSILGPLRQGMGVFCEILIWLNLTFQFSILCGVLFLYGTSIYQDAIVFESNIKEDLFSQQYINNTRPEPSPQIWSI